MKMRVVAFEGGVEDPGTLTPRAWRRLRRELSGNALVKEWGFDFEWDSSERRIRGLAVYGLVWADLDLEADVKELETALASYDVSVGCVFRVEREDLTTEIYLMDSGFTPAPLPEDGVILTSSPVDVKHQREVEEIHQAAFDLLSKAATSH